MLRWCCTPLFASCPLQTKRLEALGGFSSWSAELRQASLMLFPAACLFSLLQIAAAADEEA